jgi:hypothetical protein
MQGDVDRAWDDASLAAKLGTSCVNKEGPLVEGCPSRTWFEPP